MYLSRTLETFVKTAAKQFPVLLVTGARQVGKTTFLQHISQNDRGYVTLDDPLVLDLARRDPALFMQRFPPPVLIDEILLSLSRHHLTLKCIRIILTIKKGAGP